MTVNQKLRKATLLARALGARGRKNDYVRAGWSAAKTVGASAKHTTHLLWLQITGCFFAFFSLGGAGAAVREYKKWRIGELGPGRVYLAILFSLTFAYFAATSFWRVRQMEKRQLEKRQLSR